MVKNSGPDHRAIVTNDIVFRDLLADELQKARAHHGPPVSVHQTYGLLCEELAEFFDEVRKKRHARDPEQMVRELVQIAGVAQRCATELILPGYKNGSDHHPLRH